MTADRITLAKLEGLCDSINRLLGLPLAPYTKHDDGRFTPNAGVYHLSGQYGGWSLETMADDGSTGTHVIFPTSTKRELYDRMRAYIDGIQAARS